MLCVLTSDSDAYTQHAFSEQNKTITRKYPLLFAFLSCRNNFLGTQTGVLINHGNRAIGVRVFEVLLSISNCKAITVPSTNGSYLKRKAMMIIHIVAMQRQIRYIKTH